MAEETKSREEFVLKLREETKVYNNFPGIFDKVERDGYLQAIHIALTQIFQQEMVFALTRDLNRTPENEKQEP